MPKYSSRIVRGYSLPSAENCHFAIVRECQRTFSIVLPLRSVPYSGRQSRLETLFCSNWLNWTFLIVRECPRTFCFIEPLCYTYSIAVGGRRYVRMFGNFILSLLNWTFAIVRECPRDVLLYWTAAVSTTLRSAVVDMCERLETLFCHYWTERLQ